MCKFIITQGKQPRIKRREEGEKNMTFKELLKAQNLTDEQITAIEAEMAKQKIYTTSLEKADERYKKLKEDKENLDTQLQTATTTIEDLKKNSGNDEELKKKLEEYENEKKKQDETFKAKVKDLALENELIKVNVNSIKAAKAELDMTKIIYNESDNSFVGLSDQVEAWKKDKTWIFKEAEPQKKKKGYEPNKGKAPNEGDLASLMKSKDFNLTEYLKSQNGGE